MKIKMLFLILATISCDLNKPKESVGDPELKMEQTESIKVNKVFELDQVISGQWLTEGNGGVVSNWLEFDTARMRFYSWNNDDLKPPRASGEYMIIKDSLLQLSYYEYNRPEYYGFDSLNIDYLDLWSTGVNAGNLIYYRSAYTPPEKRIIFFHLSEAEFDSLVQIPDYEGLYEVSSDFGFYVSNVIDSLKNSTIRTDVITDRIVQLDTIQFDKFEYHGYGTVLIKNDSVLIEHGIMTDVGYFQLISEFFGVIY